jgi:predicted dinucleotide-binding enzyme
MNKLTSTITRRQLIAWSVASGLLIGLTGLPDDGFAAESSTLKIGVIGSGNVGSALGRVWAEAGHEVMFASRHLETDKSLAEDVGHRARAGTPEEAAAFADVLLLAVPYRALPELGQKLSGTLKNKIVIDACNPFPGRDGDIAVRAREKGAGITSAELLPGARIVRAFNAIGAASMGDAHKDRGKVGMPMAGNDAKAIEVAQRLIREIGYEPVLVGDLTMGRYLMPGTPLAGEHSPAEIKQIVSTLK